jgi:hypothetical protein
LESAEGPVTQSVSIPDYLASDSTLAQAVLLDYLVLKRPSASTVALSALAACCCGDHVEFGGSKRERPPG